MSLEHKLAVGGAVAALAQRFQPFPRIAIVAGSGLGGLTRSVNPRSVAPYVEIPGFPMSAVEGHVGELIVGRFGGKKVAVLAGRKHLYEGVPAEMSTFAVATVARLGARTLILTNAAGGVSGDLRPGDLMLVTDHVNLSNRGPLRFTRLTDDDASPPRESPGAIYDAELMDLARRVAARERIPLSEGVYGANLGPTYETPAETRLARWAGADAVGMSTAPEAMEGARRGMRVLAVSCVTNSHVHDEAPASHAEVIRRAKETEARFVALLKAIARALPDRA